MTILSQIFSRFLHTGFPACSDGLLSTGRRPGKSVLRDRLESPCYGRSLCNSHDTIRAMGIKVVATNRKARFEYFLLEEFEAGLALQGSEIKSVRAGQVSLNDAYVQIENGREAWLMEAHIAPYTQANRFNHDPKRPRRLLLHRREIRALWNAVRQKGMTIVPTRLYLKDGLAKLEIALARGKKLHDKRETIARRDAEREMRRGGRL